MPCRGLDQERFLAGLGGGTYAHFIRPKSREEVDVLLAAVRRDIRDTNIYSYMPM